MRLFVGLYTLPVTLIFYFFFFNDTATTEIYTLSLHDALPIFRRRRPDLCRRHGPRHLARSARIDLRPRGERAADRKSTRLNSSHQIISYAVFCLKKKKKEEFSVYKSDNKIFSTRDRRTDTLTR